jgi:hypothetical protein
MIFRSQLLVHAQRKSTGAIREINTLSHLFPLNPLLISLSPLRRPHQKPEEEQAQETHRTELSPCLRLGVSRMEEEELENLSSKEDRETQIKPISLYLFLSLNSYFF